jgi:hypothetical protein
MAAFLYYGAASSYQVEIRGLINRSFYVQIGRALVFDLWRLKGTSQAIVNN